MSTRWAVVAVSLLAVVGAACGGGNPNLGADTDDQGDQDAETEYSYDTPIGGGLASGTGVDAPLICPPGVVQDTMEWYGPAEATRDEAVDAAFGDLIVGQMGEPFEIGSTDTWSSWGIDDESGSLIAVTTIVRSGDGWDPSHARFCVIEPPRAPSAPFTLIVSNQSFDHRTVEITVTIDGEVVVEEDFPVRDQHHFVEFTPDIGPGDHTLRAVSDTGAEVTFEFTTEDGVPLWIVLDYWFSREEGTANFTVQTSEDQPGFG